MENKEREVNQEQKTTGLDDIIKNKYREAGELKASGINPYPAHVEVKNTCLQAKEAAEGTEVTTAGRLVQLRLMGKAAFAHKRKTLFNSLLLSGWDKERVTDALARAGVAPAARAQEITLEKFLEIHRLLS